MKGEDQSKIFHNLNSFREELKHKTKKRISFHVQPKSQLLAHLWSILFSTWQQLADRKRAKMYNRENEGEI
jgi:hypothetical protein